MEPVLIAGLGNPGPEYEQTRHNLGFRVVDLLCERLRCAGRPGKGEYLVAAGRAGDTDVILLRPLTYMNNSGIAVLDAVERFGIPLPRLLVVLDDAAIPLGSIRIRPGGTDGGHHGLASIVYHLQSDEFPRLRCGIGTEGGQQPGSLADFVLSPFDPGERETVTAMILRAADAAMEFATAGIERAMNKFN